MSCESSTGRWDDKHPDDNLDYALDFSQVLGDSDEISSVEWFISDDLTKTNEGNTATVATIWLSGGTDQTRYRIRCEIVTTGGRTINHVEPLSVLSV